MLGLGYPIGIPLRGIARYCSRLTRKSTKLRGNYRARNCSQVKSICVGNLSRPSEASQAAARTDLGNTIEILFYESTVVIAL